MSHERISLLRIPAPTEPADAIEPMVDRLLRAAVEGSHARAFGISSDDTPYLQRHALPRATAKDRIVWFIHVAAWWRGWDDEDLKHRARGCVNLPPTLSAYLH